MMVAGVFWRLIPLAMRSVGEFQREITLRMTRGEGAALDAVGTCYVYAQEHTRARRAYDRALAAAPGDTLLLKRRALLHRYLGDFELAAQDYDAVLAQRPADAEALKSRAELQQQTTGHGSVAAMEAALAAGPPSTED